MSSLQIGLLGVAAILILIAMRVPIGVALGVGSFAGIWAIRGIDPALGTLRSLPFEFVAHWSLSAIPMFLLMSAVAGQSGISKSLYRAARLWLNFMPGGLAVSTTFASAGMAAASGSSMATAAAMGRLAIPEMLRFKYDKGLAAGVVASAGTLGSLIPPSILIVLYAIFAEVSISQMLIAGVLPGILTAAIYVIMIVTRCSITPSLAPKIEEHHDSAEKWRALAEVWPLPVLILIVIGGIYSGIATATEAGAFGAAAAFVIAIFQRRLTWKVARDSVVEACVSTGLVFFTAIGAILLTRFLAFAGVPIYMGTLAEPIADQFILLVIGASIVFIILGMFLDPLGVMLLSLPIMLPLFEGVGADMIWFGIIVIKFLEIGLVTPPVGFNVYVIKSVVGDQIPLETIFKGVGWFIVCELIVVALLVIFPDIVLFLPSLMQ